MNLKSLFSFSKTDYNDGQSKLELLGCPFSGEKCKQQLTVINSNYLKSSEYQREKNYRQAIILLKNAYESADELHQPSCVKCADLFRSTIAQSLKNIHDELRKMTTGIFRNKRYHSVYIEAANILKE